VLARNELLLFLMDRQVIMDAMMITLSRSLRCSESGMNARNLLHSCCYEEDVILTKEGDIDVTAEEAEEDTLPSKSPSSKKLLLNMA
jgi:hypothetical protein